MSTFGYFIRLCRMDQKAALFASLFLGQVFEGVARSGGRVSFGNSIDEWAIGIGLRFEDYGTHSLRRTKASIIYKATGKLRAVQILLVT
jgi:integrase